MVKYMFHVWVDGDDDKMKSEVSSALSKLKVFWSEEEVDVDEHDFSTNNYVSVKNEIL